MSGLLWQKSGVEVDPRITAQHDKGFIEKAGKVLNPFHPARRTEGFTFESGMSHVAFVGIRHVHPMLAAIPKIVFDHRS